jgi:hypothetical protein
MVVVKSGINAGKIILKATSSGLKSASLEIESN